MGKRIFFFLAIILTLSIVMSLLGEVAPENRTGR